MFFISNYTYYLYLFLVNFFNASAILSRFLSPAEPSLKFLYPIRFACAVATAKGLSICLRTFFLASLDALVLDNNPTNKGRIF